MPVVVPGTRVEVNCFSFGYNPPTQDQLDGKDKQQPPLYYAAGEGSRNLASVNAGNAALLDVGGGGINRAFARVLGQTQTVADYRTRHVKLLARADAQSGPASEAYAIHDPCAFSYVDPTRIGNFPRWYGGVCFVDVFDTANGKLCPAQNSLNMGMVYALPPEDTNYLINTQDRALAKTNFLAAIQATAAGIINAVSAYNALAKKQKLPVVQALRNTLFSSGIYNSLLHVPAAQIARTIFAGFVQELRNNPNSGLEELQFPVGNGKIYQDDLFLAVQQDLAAGH